MLINNRFFLVKKYEIQVSISMIMLTRSSERIFNPICYTSLSSISMQPYAYTNSCLCQLVIRRAFLVQCVILVYKIVTVGPVRFIVLNNLASHKMVIKMFFNFPDFFKDFTAV